ncbi:unnamed protein product [Paramecium sonneborni]|uniref:Uncharacterized protein n=1 Tax=Paramecium sonneborni TaxID=65129 RepID=A0A8S1RQ20_9CILI|nr:unnamed protein product [Paramecium sonneborni]
MKTFLKELKEKIRTKTFIYMYNKSLMNMNKKVLQYTENLVVYFGQSMQFKYQDLQFNLLIQWMMINMILANSFNHKEEQKNKFNSQISNQKIWERIQLTSTI